MPNLEVNVDTVLNDWDLPYGDNIEEGVELLSDEIVSQSRWTITHKIIVRIKDKVYMAHYSCGATEMQETSPWEHNIVVTFIEVEEKEKVIKVWVPVEDKFDV